MSASQKYFPFKLIFLGSLCLLVLACEKPVVERQYHEIFVDNPERIMADDAAPHASLGMLPDDDIHRNLKLDDQDLKKRLTESVAPADLSWITPSDWTEKKGDGMRLASFVNADTKFPVETTIISLAGQAGGISANINRWLQQLNISLPGDFDMENFISQQEKSTNSSGLEIMLVDFTLLQSDRDNQTASMVAAIIDRKDSQVFIKMTGTKESVLKSYDAFKALIMSIKPAEPK